LRAVLARRRLRHVLVWIEHATELELALRHPLHADRTCTHITLAARAIKAGARIRLVILESPLAPKNGRTVEQNVEYARLCVRDSLHKSEAPIASHLLYAQPGVLADEVPDERALGIEAGLAWGAVADATIVYTDYGISGGMQQGIDRAKAEGRPVEFRHFAGLVKAKKDPTR
jgi:hypothetical protein